MQNEMEMRRLADELIAGFGRVVGIEEVAFDDQGRCDLSFDDQPMAICVDATMGHLHLEAPILEIPVSPSKDFYQRLLSDNLISFSNGVGCLAVSQEDNWVLWLDRTPIKDLSQSAFEDWLAKGIERAEFWSKEIQGWVNSAAPSMPVEQAPMQMVQPEVVFRP